MKTVNSLVIVLLLSLNLISKAQSNVWINYNDGFGKCPTIGSSGNEATWQTDNMDIRQLITVKGKQYAFVVYSSSSSTNIDCTPHSSFNATTCAPTLYKLDALSNKWIAVARESFNVTGISKALFTNGDTIIALSNSGRVYIFDELNLNGTGWKELTTSPFTQKQFFRLTGTAAGLDWSSIKAMDFIGDTLHCLISAIPVSGCSYNVGAEQEQGIIKWNYKTGTLTYDSIGEFPLKQLCNEGLWTVATPTSYNILDNAYGRFSLLAVYRSSLNATTCFDPAIGNKTGMNNTVKSFWVYDKIEKLWKNVSQGPNYINLTGTTCVKADVVIPTWDKKRFIVSTQIGVYEWKGNHYVKLANTNYAISSIIPLKPNGGSDRSKIIMISKTFDVELVNDGVKTPLGQDLTPCSFDYFGELSSPDNGRTLYIELANRMKDSSNCASGSCLGANQGIYKLSTDPMLNLVSTNLHLEGATYLGASGANLGNKTIGSGIRGNNIYIAGDFETPLSGNFSSNFQMVNYFGANASSRGKLLLLNQTTDTIIKVVNLGNAVYDYEMQNYGNGNMVISCDWGVCVLDSNLNITWAKSYTQLTAEGLETDKNGTDLALIDIADNGNVAISRGTRSVGAVDRNDRVFGSFSDLSKDKVGLMLFNSEGAALSQNTTIVAPKGFYDLAVKGDSIFVTYQAQVNFSVDPNVDMPACTNPGGYAGQPVQKAVIRAYSPLNGSNNTMSMLWASFDFANNELYSDMADAMPRKLNIGNDGRLYFIGETAGANSAFRWNGKLTPSKNYLENSLCSAPSTIITSDNYNTPVNTIAAQLLYFCSLDIKTGIVEKGSFLIPRMSDGKANTFSAKSAYIHADENGKVYIGGISSSSLPNREYLTVNGNLLGNYAGGDMAVAIIHPDFKSRELWTSFNKDAKATGNLNSIALNRNKVVVTGSTKTGSMFTGSTQMGSYNESYAMNPSPFYYGDKLGGANDNINDAWIGVWYQNTWVRDTFDRKQERTLASQRAIPLPCMSYKADLQANKTTVFVGEQVNISNHSIGDSCCHTWDFGANASLIPGTLGKGPFSISYSTLGSKTIELSMMDSCGQNHLATKYAYIEVIDSISINNITVNNINPLCPGKSIEVSFNVSRGTFKPENRFVVQLSDAYGSFINAIDLADVYSDLTGNYTIAAFLPYIHSGNQYKIRVVATMPSFISENSIQVVIHPEALKPNEIKGETTIHACHSTIASYKAITNEDTPQLLWEIPLGCKYIYPKGYENKVYLSGLFDSVVIDFGTSTSASIRVWGVNSYDTSDYYEEIEVFIDQNISESNFSYTVTKNLNNTYTVDFVNQSIGDILSYFWVFDDGAYSNENNPSHVYEVVGNYSTKLIINSSTCNDTTTKLLTVGGLSCMSKFTYQPIDNSTVKFTNASIGSNLIYYWAFADGTTSTTENPMHSFSQPGIYPVQLTVYNEPDHCFDYVEENIVVGESNDVQASFYYNIESSNQVQFFNQSIGNNLSYLWDFGMDNYSIDENPNRYFSAGMYTICLTVKNSFGIKNTSCSTIKINPSNDKDCKADFYYTIDSLTKEVNLFSLSQGNPTKFSWDFGDTQIDTAKNPKHIYLSNGHYRVKLMVENNSNCKSNAYRLINVNAGGGLKANYVTENVNLFKKASGYPVSFYAVNQGVAATYLWSFGDGSYDSTSMSPTHIYYSEGNYFACLTISDPITGASSNYCDTVRVSLLTDVKLSHRKSDLFEVYPNPVKDNLTVVYTLENENNVRISLFSVNGELIRLLYNDNCNLGVHKLTYFLGNLMAGVYFIRMECNNTIEMRKIIIE